MKIWMIVFFLGLGITANAQQVISGGLAYEVKGKSIFKGGNDITHTLDKDKKDHIFKTLKSQEKANKKAEKAKKKQEKAHKQATKDLKKKEKAQGNLLKASKKLEQNEAKYTKLKEKGKLSPNDEAKWQKKLKGLKINLEKMRKKV